MLDGTLGTKKILCTVVLHWLKDFCLLQTFLSQQKQRSDYARLEKLAAKRREGNRKQDERQKERKIEREKKERTKERSIEWKEERKNEK